MVAPFIYPGQQFLKVYVNRQRFRLIDQLKAGVEFGNNDGSPVPMHVAGAEVQRRQGIRILLRNERGPDGFPVGAKMAKELQAIVDPVIDTDCELTGQSRIFLQNGEHRFWSAQAPSEVLKPCFGSVSDQRAPEPGDIELKDQGPA